MSKEALSGAQHNNMMGSACKHWVQVFNPVTVVVGDEIKSLDKDGILETLSELDDTGVELKYTKGKYYVTGDWSQLCAVFNPMTVTISDAFKSLNNDGVLDSLSELDDTGVEIKYTKGNYYVTGDGSQLYEAEKTLQQRLFPDMVYDEDYPTQRDHQAQGPNRTRAASNPDRSSGLWKSVDEKDIFTTAVERFEDRKQSHVEMHSQHSKPIPPTQKDHQAQKPDRKKAEINPERSSGWWESDDEKDIFTTAVEDRKQSQVEMYSHRSKPNPSGGSQQETFRNKFVGGLEDEFAQLEVETDYWTYIQKCERHNLCKIEKQFQVKLEVVEVDRGKSMILVWPAHGKKSSDEKNKQNQRHATKEVREFYIGMFNKVQVYSAPVPPSLDVRTAIREVQGMYFNVVVKMASSLDRVVFIGEPSNLKSAKIDFLNLTGCSLEMQSQTQAREVGRQRDDKRRWYQPGKIMQKFKELVPSDMLRSVITEGLAPDTPMWFIYEPSCMAFTPHCNGNPSGNYVNHQGHSHKKHQKSDTRRGSAQHKTPGTYLDKHSPKKTFQKRSFSASDADNKHTDTNIPMLDVVRKDRLKDCHK